MVTVRTLGSISVTWLSTSSPSPGECVSTDSSPKPPRTSVSNEASAPACSDSLFANSSCSPWRPRTCTSVGFFPKLAIRKKTRPLLALGSNVQRAAVMAVFSNACPSETISIVFGVGADLGGRWFVRKTIRPLLSESCAAKSQAGSKSCATACGFQPSSAACALPRGTAGSVSNSGRRPVTINVATLPDGSL